jgi:hypothetical protein
MRPLIVFIVWIGLTLDLHAQELAVPPLYGMMRLTDTTTARISSFDRSGANTDYQPIAAGETLELARLDGAGIVRHVYFSILGGPHYLRDLVLRAYWDGQETPCVEVPFGDFFGLGQERPRFFSSLMVTVNPGDLGVFGTYGFNSYFPMPYANGARFTLTNEGPDPVGAVWYHIEYERMSALPEGLGRFHAAWHREIPRRRSARSSTDAARRDQRHERTTTSCCRKDTAASSGSFSTSTTLPRTGTAKATT